MDQYSLFLNNEPGYWIHSYDLDNEYIECSQCHSRIFIKYYFMAIGDKGINYCPYCGSKNSNLTIIRKWPERILYG